jgi:hypothetical protein
MNALTKKIVLSFIVLLLSACAYHPNHYNSYPGNGPYYRSSGYGNYQQQYPHNHRRPTTSPGYWGGRPQGDHHSNNNYYNQNNYYNRPQPNQGRGWSDHHGDHNNHSNHGDSQRHNDQPRNEHGGYGNNQKNGWNQRHFFGR